MKSATEFSSSHELLFKINFKKVFPLFQVVADTKELVSTKVTGAREVVSSTVNGAKDAVASGVHGVVGMAKGAVQGSVEMTRAVVAGGVNTVMGSRVGQMVSTGMDAMLEKSEELVDHYLPVTEHELGESNPSVGIPWPGAQRYPCCVRRPVVPLVLHLAVNSDQLEVDRNSLLQLLLSGRLMSECGDSICLLIATSLPPLSTCLIFYAILRGIPAKSNQT